ncbi:MAG: GlmU family protein [Bacteroidia bacterium]
MNLILFDSNIELLLPLTYTRPAADLRTGILTIKEKWENYTGSSCSFLAQASLQAKFKCHWEDDNIYVNGRWLPNASSAAILESLQLGQAYEHNGELIALRGGKMTLEELLEAKESTALDDSIQLISRPYDLFNLNDQEVRKDFNLITANRSSANVNETNTLIGNEIFIEEGAKINAAVLNSESGPIYIGKDAEVMEGSLIRGPFALCESSVVKLGCKIYGATTVGPHSKVGGELNNVVMQAHSNKGHDGFLGNAFIGEWCNIGADTNASNLKNNYADVKVWNYESKRFTPSGLQFCGLIMGDHSKCGINTMFNTGTVVGVSANIFGSGFPRNFVPSFSWGGSSGFTTYSLNKAFDTASKVMERRGKSLNELEENILKHIFESSSEYRIWEKNS